MVVEPANTDAKRSPLRSARCDEFKTKSSRLDNNTVSPFLAAWLSNDWTIVENEACTVWGTTWPYWPNRFSRSQIATRASIGSTTKHTLAALEANKTSSVAGPKYPAAIHVSNGPLGGGSNVFCT